MSNDRKKLKRQKELKKRANMERNNARRPVGGGGLWKFLFGR